MDINLLQALLIGLWTAFCFSGMLLGIYTNRCIILSFGVGIILGDLPTALSMGAISELAYMGFGVGAGGTVPPNPIGPGIFGTLMAITSAGKVTPEAALAYQHQSQLPSNSFRHSPIPLLLGLLKPLKNNCKKAILEASNSLLMGPFGLLLSLD